MPPVLLGGTHIAITALRKNICGHEAKSGLFEAPVIVAGLRNPKVPFLVLENDYVWSDTGRVKTRIEEFVEMIKNEFS